MAAEAGARKTIGATRSGGNCKRDSQKQWFLYLRDILKIGGGVLIVTLMTGVLLTLHGRGPGMPEILQGCGTVPHEEMSCV